MRGGSTRPLLAAVLVAVGLTTAPPAAHAVPSSPPDRSAFETNGTVDAIARGNGLTYIGGDFTGLQARTGRFAQFNGSTGMTTGAFPKVSNGEVLAVAPDGAGGYYIGGSFTAVGGMTRNRIAHLLADGSVDPAFNPNANNPIRALVVSGGAVFAGGGFDTIGGLTRPRVAKLSATSGNAFSGFDPETDGVNVHALAISGSVLYVGGDFDSIGGLPRNNVAKLSATSGNAFSAWNPSPNDPGFVRSLAVSGAAVYAGGLFNTIGGQNRNRIAKLSAASGNAFSGWNPGAPGPITGTNNAVFALALSDGAVYAGGDFTTVGSHARNGVVKLSEASGNVFSSFDPGADDDPSAADFVLALAVTEGAVYAGGDFTQVGGLPRPGLAKLSTTSGNAFSGFNPKPADPGGSPATINSLAVSGSSVAVGGNLETAVPLTRNRIAALDSAGRPTSFNPNADGRVEALAADDGVVYAGGDFSTIGGLPRPGLAKLSAASGGAFSAFNANVPGGVFSLKLSGSALYAGGAFGTIGGLDRPKIAKLSTASGNAFSGFDAQADGNVYALALDGSGLYAGGTFDSMGGAARSKIAKLSPTSGNAFSGFDPNANSNVYALALSGSALYAGGFFTNIGGEPRDGIAKLSPTSGNAFSGFDPGGVGSGVLSLATTGSEVYVGGDFTEMGGQPRKGIAALSATSGNAFSGFNPGATDEMGDVPEDNVRAIAASPTTVYMGGAFSVVNGEFRIGYAQFTEP